MNVSGSLGLGVPGKLHLHAAAQSYYKKGSTVLNCPMGSRRCSVRTRTPGKVRGMEKDHWLKSKVPRHLVSMEGIPRYTMNGFFFF